MLLNLNQSCPIKRIGVTKLILFMKLSLVKFIRYQVITKLPNCQVLVRNVRGGFPRANCDNIPPGKV